MDDHDDASGLPGSHHHDHAGPSQHHAADRDASSSASSSQSSTGDAIAQQDSHDARVTSNNYNDGDGDSPMPDAEPSSAQGPSSSTDRPPDPPDAWVTLANGDRRGTWRLPTPNLTFDRLTVPWWPPPPLPTFRQPSSSSIQRASTPMSDAHAQSSALRNTTSSQALPPPPPGLTPSAHALSLISTGWAPIPEDNSSPGIDELRRLQTSGEINAMNHAHFHALGFEHIDDPELAPKDTGTIMFTISQFSGTQEQPNQNLVMCSDPVLVGGHLWRIKIFPRGRGGTYVAAYVECLTLGEPSDAEQTGINKSSQKPVLQPLSGPSTKLLDCVAAQIILVMYNPQEPRVNYMKSIQHSFAHNDADAGWLHFGPGPRHELGRRTDDTRQPILRNDTLAFVAHVRVHNDPTSFLFLHDKHDSIKSHLRTGLRQVIDVQDQRGLAKNLTTAVLVFCLLPQIRRLLYLVHFRQRPDTPLLNSLALFLADLRRISFQRDAPPGLLPSTSVRLEQLASALEFRGFHLSSRGCGSVQCVHFTQRGAPPRVLWHPLGGSMERFDIVQLIEMLLAQMDVELIMGKPGWERKYSASPSYSRIVLTQCDGSIVEDEVQDYLEERVATDMILVELPRWVYHDTTPRAWKKNTDQVLMPEVIHIEQEAPEQVVQYDLACLVAHEGGMDSRAFTAVMRPDAGSWIQFSKSDQTQWVNTAIRLTNKQAIDDKAHSVYLAVYTRPTRVCSRFVFEPPASVLKSSPEAIYHNPGHLVNEWRLEELRGRTEPPWPEAGQVEGGACCCYRPTYFDRFYHHLTTTHAKVTIDYFGSGFYEGSMQRGYFEGSGHRIYANGSEYLGEFKRGLKHGYGRTLFCNGRLYVGTYRHGDQNNMGGEDDETRDIAFIEAYENGKRSWQYHLEGTEGDDDAAGSRKALIHSRDEECLICFESERNTVFVPCGHLAACEDCVMKMLEPGPLPCPFCRVTVQSAVQVFRP